MGGPIPITKVLRFRFISESLVIQVSQIHDGNFIWLHMKPIWEHCAQNNCTDDAYCKEPAQPYYRSALFFEPVKSSLVDKFESAEQMNNIFIPNAALGKGAKG